MGQQLQISGNESQKKSFIRKKLFKHPFLLLVVVLIILITAIAHIYGPFVGKVVDLETGAPVDGAAVLIVFYTESLFAVSAYADSVETVTDEKGEFKIPWHLSLTFHPVSKWEPDGYITIFKPGYGAYPDHDDVAPMFVPNGTIPEKQYVTFKLPKLEEFEERRRNLDSVAYIAGVPDRKMRNLLKLRSQERVNLGFSPLPASRYGE